ncbi:flagellar biosynthesis protein FlhF [Evansella sp. AB-P1]|uniref:flagellar biosynthesis protein FlhF n=1 Tax=Evansella sp. AB-P1 TaxID=3037653 RepID=UPI00241D6B29|nr:flagellar biosynthesis protein FlhF [Evansella sp. AB-P1]MDG5788172.1 flagellar biosynthesis protein FlhF [Evansella sp. AB-P1]
MKVKKFTAKDMPEAMVKIREELGNDAVILNSKRIETGGFLGLFTKKMIEVIAAIDPDIPHRQGTKHYKKEVKASSTVRNANSNKDGLVKEIADLKSMIKNMSNQSVTIQGSEEYPGFLNTINQHLLFQEVLEVYRLNILKKLLKRWYSENGDEQSEKVLWKWTEEIILDDLSDIAYGPFKYDKRYLNVVGPTGVGKTTTLAKIAAKSTLVHGKKVAFITTDTYRIAAIDQLKTYAKILNVPVEVAYSINDFKEAKERLKEYDFILVDSAGRNFRNPLYVEQLRQVIDFDDEMETHLVLSLTSKYKDMKKIIKQFQAVTLNKVIFTKADETESHGAMLNVHHEFNLGTSYITTGQNVPDDIIEASHSKLIEHVLRR